VCDNPGTTDGDGAYRVVVPNTGACTITVVHEGKRAAATVHSYDKPTAYDFELVQGRGGWELHRR